MRTTYSLQWGLFVALFLVGCRTSSEEGPPYSPQDALGTMELEDGFRIELLAAEPLVMDPVAMTIDEYGRLYVVEMPGYPLDTSGSGRIKLLRDTNQDGLPDTALLFADSLRLPTGIMRWKQGVIVTDPPDVLYLEDTDNDGRADVRRVLLTGFALSNPQHNANAPLYGLDNWIYIANNGTIWWTEKYADTFGDRGEEVHFAGLPEGQRLPPNASNRNVRFHPDRFALETLAGASQFGHTFDAWGHHFLNDNSHHHYHEVIAAPYFRRNPDLPVRRAIHYTSDHGNAAAVFPVTINPEHQLLTDRGVFTSACGITYYLGGLFPPPYDHDVTFTAEPVHNLVHVDKIASDGPTFVAQRMREGREFLASTDSWFRPVNFTVGPDGALYVVDYYRHIVEHPEWMDDMVAQSQNLQRGTDKGRIYRILPVDADPPPWIDALTLGKQDAPVLVQYLENRNAWWRQNTQRLLVDRKDSAAVEPLARLIKESTSAEARVHALFTLDGMGALDVSVLLSGLADVHPRVRENALRLAEHRLSESQELTAHLLTMGKDPSPGVRFQLLNTLGSVKGNAASRLQRQLLLQDIESEWVQIAGLLALPGEPGTLLSDALAALADRETPAHIAYLKRIAAMAGVSRDEETIRNVLRSMGPFAGAWWQTATLQGLAEGLQQGEGPISGLKQERSKLLEWAWQSAPALSVLGALGLLQGPETESAMERAWALATDRMAAPQLRIHALGLIALYESEDTSPRLRGLMVPEEPAAILQAAINALMPIGGVMPAEIILESWETLTPALRDAALEIFLLSEERVDMLLDAVEQGRILSAEVGWRRRVILMRDTEEPLRSRARVLLRTDKKTPVEMAEAINSPGDAQRGVVVFERVCGACHQAGDVGTAQYGPDLATIQHWPRTAILKKILEPNSSIASGYELWTVQRKNGIAIEGVIAEETPTSITVRNQNGEDVILRRDIASLTALPYSGMPAGLDAAISEEDMPDLLTFLRQE